MTEHYYTNNPDLAHDLHPATFISLCNELPSTTYSVVFCLFGLDMVTRILLEALPALRGRILDLGCGWGPVGVAVGKKYPDTEIVMSDVNRRAVDLARRNLAANGIKNAAAVCGDGLEAVTGAFDAILLNPPIRTGKAVIYRLFADSAKQLSENGALYIVIRKQQGAESAAKYLSTLFSRVDRIARDKGYWVFACGGVIA